MIRTADGGLVVHLHGDHGKLDKGTSTSGELKHLDARYFFDCRVDTIEEQKLCLSYPGINSNMYLFTDVAKTWRQHPRVRVPLYISLVYFLSQSLERFQGLDIALVPPSPITLFYTPELPGNWRLLPVPLLSNGLGDWAAADPQTWQWIPPAMLFAQEPVDESLLVGRVLHSCLVGDLYPPLLSDREKFQRFLTRRVGAQRVVSRAVRSALPDSLAVEGEQLVEVILNSIVADRAVQANNQQPRNDIERIGRELSAHRLALRWEYEGKFGIALDLLSIYADLVNPRAVPWETIARLKEKQHDWKGGFEARLKALEFDPAEAVRNAILYLRRIVVTQPEPANNADVKELLEKIDQALSQNSPGLYDLQLAHLELRYLDSPDKALRRIERNYREPSNRLLQILIRVRVYCAQNQYPVVSKLCKQGVKILAQTPDREGQGTRNAMSYLLMMDGIAHFGAVGQYKDVSYLIDAFSGFTQALDLAVEVQADDLIYIGSHWLVFLQGLAAHFHPQIQRTLITGINAYLYTKKLAGVEIPESFEGIPSLPWYSESLFFPRS